MSKIAEMVDNGIIRAHIGLSQMSSKFKAKMAEKRKGAVSFEYIIILVIMVAILMAAFAFLKPLIEAKIQAIGNAITNGTPVEGSGIFQGSGYGK